jgi:class 3 adenylate cyclase
MSPETYTPRHLAEKILTSRAALEGERKQVTILFADIKGSTELIQDLDPEEARTLLDGAVRAMMDAVHRYEGTVNQILGDGIMALFGAPLAHEDHAVRACYAALAIQAAIARYADQARREYGLDVEVRIGLHSGEVVVRAIASDLRMDYSAIGNTTHLAARMEQLARDGSVLLTAQTLGLAEGYVQVRSLGPARVKGLAEPVEVFELVGPAATRTRLQAAAARGLTPFVGRQAELEAIYRALEQAGRAHGQVVALVGEPGVGKSRLVWEVTHSHRTQGWLVLESSSVSYGRATSYLPIIDLLKAYCRIEPLDDERTVREKITGRLLTLDESLRSALPALLALLEVPVEDPAWQVLDPSQRRRQTLEACKRLLLRESQVQPLVLVFEDLHWIDAETQALLDSLVEGLPKARILLLVNYRPEYAHSWGSKTYYCQLRIDPLPADSAEELLQALVGWTVGEHDRAIEAGQRSLATAEALSDLSLQVVANFYLALTYWARGDHRHAIDSHRWIVAALQGDLIGERFGTAGCPAVLSRGYLAWCLAELGSILLPAKLPGVVEVVRPPHADVANAIGAAIAQVSGEVEQVFSLEQVAREEAIARASAEASRRAIAAGAHPDRVRVVDMDDMPLTYMPHDATRIRVRVVGDLDSAS